MKGRKMNAYLKNFVRVVVMLVILVSVVLLSGCQTIHGVVSDVETGAGWARRALDPQVDKMQNRRITNNDLDKQRKLEKSLIFAGEHPELLAKLKEREENK